MMKPLNFQELDDELFGQGISEDVTMTIIPLAPISNSDKINSSIILSSTQIAPNKVYGIMENIAGIHINASVRTKIKERNKKLRKSELGDRPKLFEQNATPDHKGNKYFPVLDDFVKIEEIDYSAIKRVSSFMDLNSYMLRRAKEKPHAVGVRQVGRGADLDQASEEEYLKANPDFYPMYYTGTVMREYMILEGHYTVHLKATAMVKKLLVEANQLNKVAVLGNSESLIKLIIA